MCALLHVYAYVFVYLVVYIQIHKYTQLLTHIFVYLVIYLVTYINLCTSNMHTLVYLVIYTHLCIPTYKHTHVSTPTPLRMDTHTLEVISHTHSHPLSTNFILSHSKTISLSLWYLSLSPFSFPSNTHTDTLSHSLDIVNTQLFPLQFSQILKVYLKTSFCDF